MCKCYLEKWQEVLGEMNVVTVKMRECLLDSYIGNWLSLYVLEYCNDTL